MKNNQINKLMLFGNSQTKNVLVATSELACELNWWVFEHPCYYLPVEEQLTEQSN